MRVWPTLTSINKAPAGLRLYARGISSINRTTVSPLESRVAAAGERVARVRVRKVTAMGTTYESQIVADADSGQDKWTTRYVGPQ